MMGQLTDDSAVCSERRGCGFTGRLGYLPLPYRLSPSPPSLSHPLCLFPGLSRLQGACTGAGGSGAPRPIGARHLERAQNPPPAQAARHTAIFKEGGEAQGLCPQDCPPCCMEAASHQCLGGECVSRLARLLESSRGERTPLVWPLAHTSVRELLAPGTGGGRGREAGARGWAFTSHLSRAGVVALGRARA
jgi:hypothetical protein